jgi:hypothetical protein
MSLLDKLPLPKEQGKRELVYVILLAGSIMILGFIGGRAGWLYKDVPESSPTEIVGTPPATSMPIATMAPDSTPEPGE